MTANIYDDIDLEFEGGVRVLLMHRGGDRPIITGGFMACMVAPNPPMGGGFGPSMGDGMGSYNIPNIDVSNE
jgi:hypothetical protein